MNNYFQVLLGNLLLSKGPQDLPFSIVLMRLSLIVYFLTGLPSLLFTVDAEKAVFAMALDVIVLLMFVYLCLSAFTKLPRFVQTITSLASIGTIFQLAVLPLLYHFQVDTENPQSMAGLSILLLVLISWNLAVYAHIFREAFSIRLPAAMVLTICYVVITMMAREIFFPGLT